jgi:hypothetical protein
MPSDISINLDRNEDTRNGVYGDYPSELSADYDEENERR